MDLDLSLEEFLRKRGITEDTLSYFRNENIDASALQVMEESILKKWIPRYGDRLALINFCKKKTSPKKCSLIEKLRLKIAQRSSHTNNVEDKENVPKKNKISRRTTRTIEVGWLCFNKKEKRMSQVRTNQGGGTRKIDIEKTSTCKEVLSKAKDLFFPNGVSPKGRLQKFNVALLDFKYNHIESSLTIQDMFEATGLCRLKFYLSTERKDPLITSDSEDDENLQSSSETNQTISSEIYSVLYPNEFNDVTPNFNDSRSSTTDFTNLPSTSSDLHLSSRVQNFTPEVNVGDLFEFPEQNLNLDGNGYQSEITLLTVHRGKVFDELLTAFKQDFCQLNNLQIEMLLPNGEKEVAEDMGGVFRDALTEFWITFYEKCTIGTNLKVPYLRHDFGKKEWETVAKILVKGWIEHSYFSIKLSPVFVRNCVEDTVHEGDLLKDFMRFLCESESELLQKALYDFEAIDSEELLDFFGTYDTKWVPTKENLNKLIIDIAHKELIQKPAFVAKCLRKFCNQLSIQDLGKIYIDLEPTSKNIISKLNLKQTEITSQMTAVFGYLKKYIKEADTKYREAFLRFCTGSDLANRNISISFISTEGFARASIAHTCACLLELPYTYENFVTFRSELNSILSSNIRIMDLI